MAKKTKATDNVTPETTKTTELECQSDKNPMDDSWKNFPQSNFCRICQGTHYNPDNGTRQSLVRAAMKEAQWPSNELPNACAGLHAGGCLCPYHK